MTAYNAQTVGETMSYSSNNLKFESLKYLTKTNSSENKLI